MQQSQNKNDKFDGAVHPLSASIGVLVATSFIACLWSWQHWTEMNLVDLLLLWSAAFSGSILVFLVLQGIKKLGTQVRRDD